MRRLWAMPWAELRRQPRLVAEYAAASIGRAFCTSVSILLIRAFLAGALGGHRGWAGWIAETYGAPAALWTLVALLVVAQMAAALLTYFAEVTEQRVVTAVELGVMSRVVRHLLGQSVGYFDRKTHGELLESLRRDVTNLRTAALAMASLGFEAVTAAGYVVAAIVVSPALALWSFALVPLAAWPIVLIARRTLVNAFGARRKSVAIFNRVLQVLQGIRLIKIYAREEAEAGQTLGQTRKYLDEVAEMSRQRALARIALETVAALSLIVVIIVGGLQVMAGRLGWPELLAFLMAARAVHGPLQLMNTAYVEIQRHSASVTHIETLLATSQELADAPTARPLERRPARLDLDRVSFAYDAAHLRVLEDVTVSVRAGETLAIVGPSGGGKSSLLGLIARFYDPIAGAVRVDGQDIRSVRLAEWYGAVALVTQDPFLFSGTVRDNVRCARPAASDAAVEAAVRSADLHEDVLALPQGYDTRVGPGGRALSRGEAQRLNVARAMLKDAPVLLLDEPTSSLDAVSEAKVVRAFDRLLPGRIAIVVAHRLWTVRGATRILVLVDGRVAGVGTHDELWSRCLPYRALWDAQRRDSPGGGAEAGAGGARL